MGKSKRKHSPSPPHISRRDLWKRLEILENELKNSKRARQSSRSKSPHHDRSRSRRRTHRRETFPPRERRTPSGTGSQGSYDSNKCEREGRSLRGTISPQSTGRASNGTADAVFINDGHYPSGVESKIYNNPGAALGEAQNNNNNDSSPELNMFNDIELSEDTLQILGEDPGKGKLPIFTLHKAVEARWAHLVVHGLPKEEYNNISQRHETPSNGKFLTPPIVNPEVKAIMSGPNMTRDASHSNYQRQLGIGITALGKALNNVLEEEENIPRVLKDKILSNMVDSGRILCSLHSDISQVRRQLIIPLLSKSVKDTVDNSLPGEFLFGSGLGEKIKEAKSLERTGKDLRTTQSISYPSTSGKRGRGGSHRPLSSSSYSHKLNRKRPVHQTREVRPFKGQPSKTDRRQYLKRR